MTPQRCAHCEQPAAWVNHYSYRALFQVAEGYSDNLCMHHYHATVRNPILNPRYADGDRLLYDYYLPIINVEVGGRLHIALECAFSTLAAL